MKIEVDQQESRPLIAHDAQLRHDPSLVIDGHIDVGCHVAHGQAARAVLPARHAIEICTHPADMAFPVSILAEKSVVPKIGTSSLRSVVGPRLLDGVELGLLDDLHSLGRFQALAIRLGQVHGARLEDLVRSDRHRNLAPPNLAAQALPLGFCEIVLGFFVRAYSIYTVVLIGHRSSVHFCVSPRPALQSRAGRVFSLLRGGTSFFLTWSCNPVPVPYRVQHVPGSVAEVSHACGPSSRVAPCTSALPLHPQPKRTLARRR